MADFDQEMWQDYVVEVRENLEELEPNLLLLEQDPGNNMLLGDCFRNLHSIKGAAGYMGLESTASLAHAMESLFDKVRQGNMALGPESMDLIFQGVDLLRTLTAEVEKQRSESTEVGPVIQAFESLVKDPGSAKKEPEQSEDHDKGQNLEPSGLSNEGQFDDPELFSIYLDEIKSLFQQLMDLGNQQPVSKETVFNIVVDMERVTHYVGIESILFALRSLKEHIQEIDSDHFEEDEFVSVVSRTRQVLEEVTGPLPPEGSSFGQSVEMQEISEEDQELFQIFLDFAKETAVPLAMVPDEFDRAWVISCQKAIEKLKSSANYMDYEKLVAFLQEWEERLAEVLSAGAKKAAFDPTPLKQMWEKLVELLPGLSEIEKGAKAKGTVQDQADHEEEIIEDLDAAIDNLFETQLQGSETHQEEPQRQKASLSVSQVSSQELPPQQETTKESAGSSKAASSPAKELLQSRTVRIDLDRVEQLLAEVGELVVIRSSFSKMAEDAKAIYRSWMDRRLLSPRQLKPLKELAMGLGEQVGVLERVLRGLQDEVMNMRMLPVHHLFSRYPRLVRDLCKKLGKKAQLVMAGTETFLDKRMLEQIADPMLHIIRNSLDHGIEDPEIRRHMGKPEAGRIEISASQEGNFVLIRVRDDGKGLDREGLIRRAVSLGLMNREEAQTANDEKIWEIIFYPGISTSSSVSETSGRGVGMDVVKKNIERLGGTVRIESEPGRGTSIELRIPLTLAIIQALLVRVGRQTMAVPLSSVREAIRIGSSEVNSVEGFDVISLRQQTYPLIRLGKIFRGTGARLDAEKIFVVIVRHGELEAGLGVDALLGQQEVVIKPLAEYLTDQPGFAGSTVLGDGSIALILDVPAVLERARSFVSRQRQILDRMALETSIMPESSDLIH